ncbi:MAG: tRNA epoxyqueuosine(34) reductase QueG [Verrucomicrobia bacterium]|nr:tRNA epoxyqueuosine(34) reductase QueG [Verrucomicrobiota bacterium]
MKTALQAKALELGFNACRVAAASPPDHAEALTRWLAEGCHGEMAWLARNAAKRRQPDLVLPGARSVILVAASYKAMTPSPAPTTLPRITGTVARYARYADYHQVIGPRLAELTAWLNHLGGPATRSLWYVDTGPVLERDLAQRAGIGFIGKHTNLISRRMGNWLLLGEILTTLALEPDPPEVNRCGACTRCLAACPTRAITAPFRLDARRCISYLTIELKGPIPLELRPALGDRIFGCDDCLAVCPWNRFAEAARLLQPHARPDLARPDLIDWLKLDEAGFKRRFAGTALERTKRRGLLRNVCVALGNAGDARALPALARAAADPEPLIAEHAAWAVREIEARL